MDSLVTWPVILDALVERRDLTVGQSNWAMDQIMTGNASEAQIAAFLIALRAKGETVEELLGFRDAILAHAVPLAGSTRVLDIVGTGGDRHHTVNVSTMASIVIAASGIPVLKHGNRAASSASGSSDVLGELGVIPSSEDPAAVRAILEEAGISFVWAMRFHPGYRHAGAVRAELGVPTVFNFLGPLINPARPDVSLVGVADKRKIEQIVGVFATRGATAFVFRGEDGLDELTTTGHSELWEISRGEVVQHDVNPFELGIAKATLADLRGGDPAHNAKIVRDVLDGQHGAVRDIVLLNAGAAITAWRLDLDPAQRDVAFSERLKRGIETAREALDSGAATRTLEAWRAAAARWAA